MENVGAKCLEFEKKQTKPKIPVEFESWNELLLALETELGETRKSWIGHSINVTQFKIMGKCILEE